VSALVAATTTRVDETGAFARQSGTSRSIHQVNHHNVDLVLLGKPTGRAAEINFRTFGRLGIHSVSSLTRKHVARMARLDGQVKQYRGVPETDFGSPPPQGPFGWAPRSHQFGGSWEQIIYSLVVFIASCSYLGVVRNQAKITRIEQ
jgi:hypothetical protein